MPTLNPPHAAATAPATPPAAEVGSGERLLNQSLAQLYTLQGRLKPKAVRHIRE